MSLHKAATVQMFYINNGSKDCDVKGVTHSDNPI